MSADGKPSVLIIGGLGYIGRWLALHIHTNKLASEIRIVDKILPQLARLAPEFEEACSNFVQGDMSRQPALEKVFTRADGSSWDYVFNCGGETKYSQEDGIYQQRIVGLAVAAGKEAAKRGVKLFVELSDARVYQPNVTGSKEMDTPKPGIPLAKYKLLAEEELRKIEGLNLLVLRMVKVYGPYSSKYLSTVLCNARVYQYLEQEMKWLHTKDLRMNTLHIDDAVRAIWHASEWYVGGKKGWDDSWGTVPLFNVVDDGDTSQGMIVGYIENIFKIKAGFAGSLISQLAKLNLGDAVDEANDAVLTPWAELLHIAGINRPGPITPFLEKELLRDANLCADGAKFKEVTNFTYEKPKLTEELMRDMLESFKRMNWWP